MPKVIDVTELQRHFHTILAEVAHDNHVYLLTRDGHPQAALMPYDAYLHLIQHQEAMLLAEFDQHTAHVAHQNRRYTEAEVAGDVAHAMRAHRANESHEGDDSP